MSEEQPKAVNNPIAKSKRNPYTVWFVVLSFAAPVALAYIMFFFIDVKSFVNHGELLNPIIHISDLKLKNENDELIPEEKLTYKWRLVSFVGSSCDQQCEKRLHDAQQIHTSLAKNQHRVLRMTVFMQQASETPSSLISSQQEHTIQVYGNEIIIKDAFAANIRSDVGINNNEIYIMDPRGNVMMRFTQDQPNKEFLHDLKKLLKASQIG